MSTLLLSEGLIVAGTYSLYQLISQEDAQFSVPFEVALMISCKLFCYHDFRNDVCLPND